MCRYVLEIALLTSKTLAVGEHFPADIESTSVMILARNLEKMYFAVTVFEHICPGFQKAMIRKFKIGPVSDVKGPRYQPDCIAFFTAAWYRDLTMFRKLRGFKNTFVRGNLPKELANDIMEEIRQDEFKDPESVMKTLTAKKDEVAEAYHTGDFKRAYAVWSTASSEMRRMRSGSSWQKLIKQGGEAFIFNVACTKFDVGINLVQAGIGGWRALLRSVSIANVADAEPHESRAQGGLRDAGDCLWRIISRRTTVGLPSNDQFAKLFCQEALYLRLWGADSNAEYAMDFIEKAETLLPNDAVIREDHRMNQQWVTGGGRGPLF